MRQTLKYGRYILDLMVALYCVRIAVWVSLSIYYAINFSYWFDRLVLGAFAMVLSLLLAGSIYLMYYIVIDTVREVFTEN